MLNDYRDITSRINDTPRWFDANGVPRFAPFHPNLSPNIYAAEVLLYQIACQACGKRFLVEENQNRYDLKAISRGGNRKDIS